MKIKESKSVISHLRAYDPRLMDDIAVIESPSLKILQDTCRMLSKSESEYSDANDRDWLQQMLLRHERLNNFTLDPSDSYRIGELVCTMLYIIEMSNARKYVADGWEPSALRLLYRLAVAELQKKLNKPLTTVLQSVIFGV